MDKYGRSRPVVVQPTKDYKTCLMQPRKREWVKSVVVDNSDLRPQSAPPAYVQAPPSRASAAQSYTRTAADNCTNISRRHLKQNKQVHALDEAPFEARLQHLALARADLERGEQPADEDDERVLRERLAGADAAPEAEGPLRGVARGVRGVEEALGEEGVRRVHGVVRERERPAPDENTFRCIEGRGGLPDVGDDDGAFGDVVPVVDVRLCAAPRDAWRGVTTRGIDGHAAY